MNMTRDYVHHYRGYWSDGGKCRIRIYWEDGHAPVVVCSQVPDNDNTSVTNGRVPGRGGDPGAQAAHANRVDRTLSRARGRGGRVLRGDVLCLGVDGGMPGRGLTSSVVGIVPSRNG
jgi:hypothetical protein